jgi:hypothetical protein
MRYLLLIYGDETQAQQQPEDMEATLKPWWDYGQWLKDQGWYLGGDALQQTSAATTVRVDAGKTLTVDGPFAETKEQLGGYYMIDCENLDQAIDAASRIPSVQWGGTIEVRPIQEFPEAPGGSGG